MRIIGTKKSCLAGCGVELEVTFLIRTTRTVRSLDTEVVLCPLMAEELYHLFFYRPQRCVCFYLDFAAMAISRDAAVCAHIERFDDFMQSRIVE